VFYYNGQRITATEVNAPSVTCVDESAQRKHIGKSRENFNAGFDGYLDEVRIYNRLLSSDEINRLYKIGATAKFGVANNNGSLTDGLVGYWSFDGKDVAGSDPLTAYDRSGQGNNATSSGSSVPSRVLGRLGQALSFDGANDFLAMNSVPPVTGDAAVSFWMYTTANPGTNKAMLYLVNPGSENTDFIVVGIDTGGKISADAADTGNGSNQRVATNTWLHIAVTKTASNVRQVFVNGVDDTSNTSSPFGGPTARGFIGSSSGVAFFNGVIDDVRIYNRALSADEIKRLYNMGR
jgi:hypothetical protein